MMQNHAQQQNMMMGHQNHAQQHNMMMAHQNHSQQHNMMMQNMLHGFDPSMVPVVSIQPQDVICLGIGWPQHSMFSKFIQPRFDEWDAAKDKSKFCESIVAHVYASGGRFLGMRDQNGQYLQILTGKQPETLLAMGFTNEQTHRKKVKPDHTTTRGAATMTSAMPNGTNPVAKSNNQKRKSSENENKPQETSVISDEESCKRHKAGGDGPELRTQRIMRTADDPHRNNENAKESNKGSSTDPQMFKTQPPARDTQILEAHVKLPSPRTNSAVNVKSMQVVTPTNSTIAANKTLEAALPTKATTLSKASLQGTPPTTFGATVQTVCHRTPPTKPATAETAMRPTPPTKTAIAETAMQPTPPTKPAIDRKTLQTTNAEKTDKISPSKHRINKTNKEVQGEPGLTKAPTVLTRARKKSLQQSYKKGLAVDAPDQQHYENSNDSLRLSLIATRKPDTSEKLYGSSNGSKADGNGHDPDVLVPVVATACSAELEQKTVAAQDRLQKLHDALKNEQKSDLEPGICFFDDALGAVKEFPHDVDIHVQSLRVLSKGIETEIPSFLEQRKDCLNVAIGAMDKFSRDFAIQSNALKLVMCLQQIGPIPEEKTLHIVKSMKTTLNNASEWADKDCSTAKLSKTALQQGSAFLQKLSQTRYGRNILVNADCVGALIAGCQKNSDPTTQFHALKAIALLFDNDGVPLGKAVSVLPLVKIAFAIASSSNETKRDQLELLGDTVKFAYFILWKIREGKLGRRAILDDGCFDEIALYCEKTGDLSQFLDPLKLANALVVDVDFAAINKATPGIIRLVTSAFALLSGGKVSDERSTEVVEQGSNMLWKICKEKDGPALLIRSGCDDVIYCLTKISSYFEKMGYLSGFLEPLKLGRALVQDSGLGLDNAALIVPLVKNAFNWLSWETKASQALSKEVVEQGYDILFKICQTKAGRNFLKGCDCDEVLFSCMKKAPASAEPRKLLKWLFLRVHQDDVEAYMNGELS